MADQFASNTLVGLAIAFLGGSGLVGFATALLKWRPERTNILVDAAQGAVVIQSGVIEDLNRQLVALRQQVATLQEEVHTLSDNLTAAVKERDRIRFERDALQARYDRLASGGTPPAAA